MKAVRSALVGAWMDGTMLVLFVIFLPTFLMPRQALDVGVRLWCRMTLWGLRVIGGVRVEVRGREHMPTGGALIAGKHQSMLDTLAPWLWLGDPAYVLKRQLLSLPIFGWGVRKVRMIAVDREAHAAALRRLVDDARREIDDARQVIIFPEGTRSEPGDPPAYKPGVAALYRELGVGCTPMATNSGLRWSAKGLSLTPGLAVYEFLPAIPPGLKRAEFMRELQARLEGASTALLTNGGPSHG